MKRGLTSRTWSRLVSSTSNDRGASAVEYALIVALIAIVITVGVGAFGTQLNTFFNNLWTNLGL